MDVNLTVMRKMLNVKGVTYLGLQYYEPFVVVVIVFVEHAMCEAIGLLVPVGVFNIIH